MSANIVHLSEIRFLVCAAQLWQIHWYCGNVHRHLSCVDADEASRIGEVLVTENVRSVSHRYPHLAVADLPGPIGGPSPYSEHNIAWNFKLGGDRLSLRVLAMLASYEYQSCEHPEWEASEAFAFCRALRSWAIHELPGYREARDMANPLADLPIPAPVAAQAQGQEVRS